METKYRQFFFDLRGKLLSGLITYEKAKEEAKPILEEMNKKVAEIAKKHNRKPRFFDLTGFLR